MSKEQGKRKKEKKVHTYYTITDGKITRKLKKCPRCASFMAFHQGEKSRYSCGKCAYTEYQTTSTIE